MLGAPVRVAIMNDFEVVVAGVHRMLAPYEGRIHVVELVSQLPVLSKVDVLLYDAFSRERVIGPVEQVIADTDARVIIYTWHLEPELVSEALAAGAAGVVSKASPIGDVIAAISTVASGEPLNNVEWASAVEGDRAFADAQLSARERDVLRLYAAGLPLKVVADRLGVAYSTAKENITRVRVKYVEVGRPAPTKVDLLRRAMEDGILAEPSDREGAGGIGA